MTIRGRKNFVLLAALAGSTSLMLVNFIALRMNAGSQATVAAVVNFSGRQRMLSQRTALLARELSLSSEPAEQAALRNELNDAISLFDQSHHALISGDPKTGLPGDLTATVRAIYFESPTRLDERVRRYSSELKSLAESPDDQLGEDNRHLRNIHAAATSGVLLRGLDAVVSAHQHDAESRIGQLGWFIWWVSGSSLLAVTATFYLASRALGEEVHLNVSLENALNQVRQAHDQLEQRVQERTRSLAQANDELRLAAVAFQTHEYILVTDENSKILRVNDRFTELTGYSAEEAIGQTPRMLQSGNHGHEFYRKMWRQISAQGFWEGEILNKRKNGEILPQWLTITAVKNGLGTPTHYVGVGLDISERKQAAADRAALTVAGDVQQNLFPSEGPYLPGFDIAGAAWPAEHVSGDYFDFIPLGNKLVDLIVGDVSGHGLGASLLMAQMQAFLHTLVEHHNDPGEILMRANRLLGSGRLVTFFLAQLDAKTRTFVYAGAGHCGYLFRRSGVVKVLDATSMPLGVLDELAISSAPAIVLEPGDLILLPTDGIWEAMNPAGDSLGTQSMLDHVHANRDRSAREIVHSLYDATLDFSAGEQQNDDITAVVIKGLDD